MGMNLAARGFFSAITPGSRSSSAGSVTSSGRAAHRGRAAG